MARVTSKLQVTFPKSLAQRCGISSGDQIVWAIAADGIRITPAVKGSKSPSNETALELFDAFQHGKWYGSVRELNPFV